MTPFAWELEGIGLFELDSSTFEGCEEVTVMVRQYVPMKLESGKVASKLERQPWAEHDWDLE